MPRKKPPEGKQARQFAFVLAGLALLAAAGFHYLGGHSGRALVALAVGGGALLCSLAAFPLWLRFFRVWMKFAEVMSVVMSTVILTVFFFVIFTPITLVMRLSGKKMLDLAWRDGRASYWIDKESTEPSLERYRKQF